MNVFTPPNRSIANCLGQWISEGRTRKQGRNCLKRELVHIIKHFDNATAIAYRNWLDYIGCYPLKRSTNTKRKLIAYKLDDLKNLNLTKGESFNVLKEINITFDFALPQGWLDSLTLYALIVSPQLTYDIILSTTVWVYPGSYPLSNCQEVVELIKNYQELSAPEFSRLVEQFDKK